MIRRVLIFVLLFSSLESLAQVPAFDKLELLYNQGHYKMVYRRSNRLLDKPEYDYSFLPEFYLALSQFKLSQNRQWLNRHPDALTDAERLFRSVKTSSEGYKVIEAHVNEVSSLKRELLSHAENLRRSGKKAEFDRLYSVVKGLFDDIPDFDLSSPKESDTVDFEEDALVNAYQTERIQLVDFAKTHLGVPYLWAGNDTSGFDCSGFTCYVMRQGGKELPRRAVDQYEKARKVKYRNAQKGDLVFFDNGSGISHVGMLISDRGKPLVMIHASSSSGVVITEIERSEYWLKKLKGFGTYLY
jgi:hypothetical protein